MIDNSQTIFASSVFFDQIKPWTFDVTTSPRLILPKTLSPDGGVELDLEEIEYQIVSPTPFQGDLQSSQVDSSPSCGLFGEIECGEHGIQYECECQCEKGWISAITQFRIY
eukprot:TRINITY_DN51780_c0_g1_i1.p1 TRINITY_DN51780_c0_g1~~TRINITY_DN51780_c0_g1_i1.p1  ORF type:complete len:130 (-),score=17.92 TRINITY_DN51780_c0_g1_i1:29-361(-)